MATDSIRPEILKKLPMGAFKTAERSYVISLTIFPPSGRDYRDVRFSAFLDDNLKTGACDSANE